jgi:aminoacyl tRNA synthase complex-interacting multifunctional protein 1
MTMTKSTAANALDLIDALIADLEAKLHLSPGGSLPSTDGKKNEAKQKEKKDNNKATSNNNKPASANIIASNKQNQPDICKLEFKVGQITKVWVHPDADKLYCEEIDIGEETGPRQIASGLRPHFTEEQMLGQRLLVVSNLKAKNLMGFKSHGMVLCASNQDSDGLVLLEFVEPPPDANIGEVITFEGLPRPEPWSAAQVEKKKVFATCMEGMKTTEDCVATWNGHKFMTSAGPCKTKSIAGGVLR